MGTTPRSRLHGLDTEYQEYVKMVVHQALLLAEKSA